MMAYTETIPYQVVVQVPQVICRMVPQKITLPAEPCCPDCCNNCSNISEIGDAYFDYGGYQLNRFKQWLSK